MSDADTKEKALASSLITSSQHSDHSDAEKKKEKEKMNDYADNPVGNTGLVEAIAVNEAEEKNFYESAPVSYATEYDPHNRIPFHRNKRVLLYTLALIVLVVMIAGAVTTVTTHNVIYLDVTDVPTITPPTPPPTTVRDTRGVWERLARISGPEILLAHTSGDNRNSTYGHLRDLPQYQAAQWIVNVDEAELLPEDDERLQQRYVLALLYFSMGGDAWKKCGRTYRNPSEAQVENMTVRDQDCVYQDKYKDKDMRYFVEAKFLSRFHECEWFGVQCNYNKLVTEINWYGNNLRGTIPTEIALLSKLYQIRFNDNHLTGTLPTIVGEFRHLLVLEVHANQLTGKLPTELFDVDTLQSLSLAMNQFTGPIPPEVSNLKSLKGIHMFENRLMGTIPNSIGTLPYLTFCYLQKNEFTGALPESFYESRTLRQILVGKNRLNGSLPPDIGKMDQLEFLRIDNNEFTGTLPDELYNLFNLKNLFLESNRFTGTISSKVGQLRNIRKMNLRNNMFTGTIPTELGRLFEAESFRFHYNDFDGSMPQEVCQLRSQKLKEMFGDCLAEYSGVAAVECSCCTDCCDRAQELCFRNNDWVANKPTRRLRR